MDLTLFMSGLCQRTINFYSNFSMSLIMSRLRFKYTERSNAGLAPSNLTVPALFKRPSLLNANIAIFCGLYKAKINLTIVYVRILA